MAHLILNPSGPPSPGGIYVEDCILTMERMVPGSLPLIVTSPPYDEARIYQGFSFDLPTIGRLAYRNLCDGGIMAWVVGDTTDPKTGGERLTAFRQALYLTDDIGFIMHDTMIYKKLNFSNPSKTRYHQTFEYVFILSKGRPRTFNPLKDRPNKSAGDKGAFGANTVTQVDGSKKMREVKTIEPFGMRHNVWEGLTRGQEDMCKKQTHPALMPRWLARDLILSWSNPGEVVYDPMGGEGTTAEEAHKVGRQWILSEMGMGYSEKALDNLQKLGA